MQELPSQPTRQFYREQYNVKAIEVIEFVQEETYLKFLVSFAQIKMFKIECYTVTIALKFSINI